ncbi:MAG: Crp/Fnr family transcriptional regulator [Anaerolineales bacterium]|nr:Crp/Fnr family transcriptional regulator [Anaerolineales bacterium]
MPNLTNDLSQAEFISALPENEQQELFKQALSRKLEVGEFLCHQGDIWPKVIFLGSGQLRWSILSITGREFVLFLVDAGRVFWGHSIFDDQPMPASLMATKQSWVYLWPREIILPILYRNPKAMWEITKTLTSTMRRAREIIYGLAFQPVACRLAKYLLGRFELEDDPNIERDITLGELASRLATSQEVVCRVLYQFQSEGILEVNRASISIQDLTALNRLVENG